MSGGGLPGVDPTEGAGTLGRGERHEQEAHGREPGRGSDESGIIVFGGGNGCSGRGYLFWILISVVLSVTLTVLLNLVVYLF